MGEFHEIMGTKPANTVSGELSNQFVSEKNDGHAIIFIKIHFIKIMK